MPETLLILSGFVSYNVLWNQVDGKPPSRMEPVAGDIGVVAPVGRGRIGAEALLAGRRPGEPAVEPASPRGGDVGRLAVARSFGGGRAG